MIQKDIFCTVRQCPGRLCEHAIMGVISTLFRKTMALRRLPVSTTTHQQCREWQKDLENKFHYFLVRTAIFVTGVGGLGWCSFYFAFFVLSLENPLPIEDSVILRTSQ